MPYAWQISVNLSHVGCISLLQSDTKALKATTYGKKDDLPSTVLHGSQRIAKLELAV